MLWQSINSKRQKEYDCRFCRKEDKAGNSRFAKRTCYWYGGEVQQVKITADVVDEDGNFVCRKGVETLSVEGLCNAITDITDVYTDFSPFKVLQIFMSNVCPKSFLDRDIDELIAMESFCKDYHLQPFGSEVGYLDYPVRLREVFSVISNTRERVKMEEMKAVTEKHKVGK